MENMDSATSNYFTTAPYGNHVASGAQHTPGRMSAGTPATPYQAPPKFVNTVQVLLPTDGTELPEYQSENPISELNMFAQRNRTLIEYRIANEDDQ